VVRGDISAVAVSAAAAAAAIAWSNRAVTSKTHCQVIGGHRNFRLASATLFY